MEQGTLLYEIFKDADALDRFRLAVNGLDRRMLRTEAAGELVDFAKRLVEKSQSVRPVLEPNKYLIIVDMQNDFVTGTLGTEEAQEMAASAVKKAEQYQGNVVFTLDSHPENYLDTQEGNLLPVAHCITGTDVCVISNAILLKAALPEVPIYVDADCCAGTTTEKHRAALEIMESCQIRIRERW